MKKNASPLAVMTLAIVFLAMLLSGCGAKNDAAGIAAGTYVGTGSGHGGEIQVRVDIDNAGKIRSVEVIEHHETEGYGDLAVAQLPGRIVDEQSLGVDAVTGATITSRAILDAVADAVSQAGGDPVAMGFVSVNEIADNDVVTIVGLPESDVQITGAQLKTEFEPVTVQAVSVSSSGEEKEITATGVMLEDILNHYGASQQDYGSILTLASDGYSIEIPDSILKTRDILIAYEVNGEPQSPRTVIPDERAMYWSKFLTRIELLGENAAQSAETKEILLLETAIANMEDDWEDYKYYDTIQKAVPVSELLERYVLLRADFVRFMATDQLSKNERFDTFAAQYIMFTGPEADVPLFIGPGLPEGMRVKQLMFTQVDTVNLTSLSMVLKVAGKDGISLNELFALTGMAETEDGAGSYSLISDDGNMLKISAEDAVQTVLYLDEDGLPAVRFEDREEEVRRLLRICLNGEIEVQQG